MKKAEVQACLQKIRLSVLGELGYTRERALLDLINDVSAARELKQYSTVIAGDKILAQATGLISGGQSVSATEESEPEPMTAEEKLIHEETATFYKNRMANIGIANRG